MTKHDVLISFLILLAAPACRDNPKYCEGNPGNNCDNMWDASVECTSSAQCSGTTPACDTASMTCVQCTTAEASACTGTTPVCGNEKSCRGCVAHSECSSSNACNSETGACIGEADVAYVAAGGTGNCDKATPCGTMAAGLAKNRAFVKVTGALNETTTTTINRAVTIIAAPGASINTMQDDVPVVSIATSNADVAIYDLEVTGGTMTGGVGIALPTGGTPKLRLVRAKVAGNQGGGISSSAGTLTVTRSTFSGNAGGGISINNAGFKIVGNTFFANGAPNGAVGGLSIQTTQDAANRLDFNSFNKNQVQDGLGAGVHCVAGTFTARNNILSDNGTLSNLNQTGGTCAHAYSIARPGTLPAGTGNSSMDPKFVNTTTGDLHIQATSPARNAADPSADLTGIALNDIDGDVRTAPADIGADQVP